MPPDEDRRRMVERDLAGRGIKDKRVLEAMGRIPREDYVWDVDREEAYVDHPLRIGSGQTISQPYMVALMTEELALAGDEKVLEIGSGSGYQTAVLAELAAEVHTVERIRELSDYAEGKLRDHGYGNVRTHVADGTLGLPEQAPFDRIMVTAGAPEVPEALKEQLGEGGRLVIPVGPGSGQTLLTITRNGDAFRTKRGIPCIFVKLRGGQGWPE